MVSATPMPALSLGPPPPPPVTAGGAPGGPTAMMMYPSLYNPTVFAVAPDTMVTTAFQPDASSMPVSTVTGSVVAVTTAAGCAMETVAGCTTSVTPATTTTITTLTTASDSTKASTKEVSNVKNGETDVCCRCRQKAPEGDDDQRFLVCGDCGLKGETHSAFRNPL